MAAIDRLLEIMATVRDPQRGCPWDLEQTFATIAPYTIEEAYEVADAIERADSSALRDELGDLLFQVVFHSRMAQEQGSFAFDDVVAAICDKLERRHPHVFGSAQIDNAAAQTVAWEEQKRLEREYRRRGGDWRDTFDDEQTRLYNYTAHPRGERAFCLAAQPVLAEIAQVPGDELIAFAAKSLISLDRALVGGTNGASRR